jgi:ring-1,2-phenylacetyl-CoA epoxidase subunit PaaD
MIVKNLDSLDHYQKLAAWRLLSTIPDPEIPVITIAELGMLRALDFEDGQWVVTFTPTYSGCPATDMLIDDITQQMTLAGYTPVRVKISLDPAWTTDWMSSESKQKLSDYGIAPPQGTACFQSDLPTSVTCPNCSNQSTQLISEFGSTACKAHYKCLICYEPFDYFKCI